MGHVGTETKTLFDGLLSISNIIVIITVCATIVGTGLAIIVFLRNLAKDRQAEEDRRQKRDDDRDEKIMKAINDRDAVVHGRLDDYKEMIDSFWKRPEIEHRIDHERRNTDNQGKLLLERIERQGTEHHALSLEVARLHERMNMRDKADVEFKSILKDMQLDIRDIAIKQGVR